MIVLFLTFLFGMSLYLYSTRTFNYWRIKGIKHDTPLPFLGNHAKVYFMKKSRTQQVSDFYRKYPNERVVGYFRSAAPELIIRDPEIIKRILITDFDHFYFRKSIPGADFGAEPLLGHIFAAEGDRWKLLRTRLSPAFTSGKLKAMFPLIVERADRLHHRIKASLGAPIDAKDLMARFTTDFIGAVGFGLEMDALSDQNSEFSKLSRKIFKLRVVDALKIYLVQLFPGLGKKLKIRFTEEVQADVFALVRYVLEQRNYEPSSRNDFVDLLLECRQKGTIVGESIEKFKSDGAPEIATLEITEDLMAAQMFVFLAAGFETSSSTTSYTLHLLAYNQEEQRKVHENIERVLAKYDNKLCYDAVNEMHYLKWAFEEGMRIFPSLGILIRECAHKCDIPELGLTVDVGVKMLIPVEALQNDPEYFENPDEYRPERFSPEELDVEKTKYAYLPFGDGPRACIGERLGLMQSMAGLAAVLSKFSVEPAPNSVKHPVVTRSPSFIQTIGGGLPLLFRERKTIQ